MSSYLRGPFRKSHPSRGRGVDITWNGAFDIVQFHPIHHLRHLGIYRKVRSFQHYKWRRLATLTIMMSIIHRWESFLGFYYSAVPIETKLISPAINYNSSISCKERQFKLKQPWEINVKTTWLPHPVSALVHLNIENRWPQAVAETSHLRSTKFQTSFWFDFVFGQRYIAKSPWQTMYRRERYTDKRA